ncbi:hypothetical protein DPMN_026019 [Dreissena polymorpha]|uniref:Uncharacterized protein n=1 Tax=Dreissena polymorpha TaxID=45954 RepID=A0A9D4LSL0_DREPO|nr:hypothetical protein DPMN_026019 [Dreissena polymorpha]
MYMKGKEDNDVELFEYQKELAGEGCEGENVVIMAPHKLWENVRGQPYNASSSP